MNHVCILWISRYVASKEPRNQLWHQSTRLPLSLLSPQNLRFKYIRGQVDQKRHPVALDPQVLLFFNLAAFAVERLTISVTYFSLETISLRCHGYLREA